MRGRRRRSNFPPRPIAPRRLSRNVKRSHCALRSPSRARMTRSGGGARRPRRAPLRASLSPSASGRCTRTTPIFAASSAAATSAPRCTSPAGRGATSRSRPCQSGRVRQREGGEAATASLLVNEARALKRVHHANVVRLLGACATPPMLLMCGFHSE